MTDSRSLSFFTLMLLASFASVNAVLFTPALPALTAWFAVTDSMAQQTILWFMPGYAIGQLLYGPLANRFGRKPALYIGIGLQVLSSFLCVLAGYLHHFSLLLTGRFLLAVGSAVGLKMTFTLVNECYQQEVANQKISYLMLAFAITPGLSVALGGVLTAHYGWESCFYAGALYGLVLGWLVSRFPETKKTLQYDALRVRTLLQNYGRQFSRANLVFGGLLMGCATSFIYVFSALSPFIAMSIMGMSSVQYGSATLLPSIGLVVGSLLSAWLSRRIANINTVVLGIVIAALSSLLMLLLVLSGQSVIVFLFTPTILIYLGSSLVFPNASTLAMQGVTDTSNAAAVMSFVNMGLATLLVSGLNWFVVTPVLLPLACLGLCALMLLFFWIWVFQQKCI